MTKEEFQILLMLYVANIDGKKHADELSVILEKYNPAAYMKTQKLFMKMNDIEVLQCIEENKYKYAATEEDRQQLLENLQAVIEADGRLMAIEEHVVRTIARILK